MIGTRLSHYRIVEEISRGGMGVVYRAVDVNLGRDVALKVLPEDLVDAENRRKRLVQEARAASALEHPHIDVIHEVGEADGVTFIAMELIRGEKLSDVLSRGPLPPTGALSVTTEIAEALARAHETGIVHRDLKPANVMVTHDGHAKVISDCKGARHRLARWRQSAGPRFKSERRLHALIFDKPSQFVAWPYLQV
jgi:eukaryotic-like serine/threonine-protein kinase